MSRTLDLDHGLRFASGGIKAPCLGDWNVFIGCPVQDHHWRADAADERLGIELIGEEQPVREGRAAPLEQPQHRGVGRVEEDASNRPLTSEKGDRDAGSEALSEYGDPGFWRGGMDEIKGGARIGPELDLTRGARGAAIATIVDRHHPSWSEIAITTANRRCRIG